MKKYPSIDDIAFNKNIASKYKLLKIQPTVQNIDKYCQSNKAFKLQEPQKFVASFINPVTPYKSLLVYHRIGAGKTCAAIQIAEQWKHLRRIVFVVPASLKGNLRDELRSKCGNDAYLTQREREEMAKLSQTDSAFKSIINRSDERIDKYYEIYSYNIFFAMVKNEEVNLKNALLIIDEIQNLVSETGSYYKLLQDLINKSPNDLRIVVLSATPIFDKPVEIALTINLLRPKILMPVGKEFENTFIKKKITNSICSYKMKNVDLFKKYLRGYVSYYSGAPSYTFPELKRKYVHCEMSDFQYGIYKKLVIKETQANIIGKDEDAILNATDLPNNFYVGTRFVANIVFPNKKIGSVGFKSLTHDKITNNLAKYSAKFSELIARVMHSKGKIFIYSGFKEYAGLKSIIKILEAYGYKNYTKHGIGKNRFAVWSGDESSKIKDDIKRTFNAPDNLHGKKLRIMLGSPSIKEGVTLKAVRNVHVLEPYWNKSRLEQVIGRASRFCSHYELHENQRKVRVYIYIATNHNEPMAVDQFIMLLAENKDKLNTQFEKAIKESAIDCRLNISANRDHIDKCD